MALPCGIFACIASFGMLGANDSAMYTSTKATAMMCNIASTVIGVIWVIIIVILMIISTKAESLYDDDVWHND
jgi:purine-cytosine permease-like protein